MKNFLLSLLFLFLAPIFSFGQFTDDFADGDFTSNPTWNGDVSEFIVVGNELRSDGPNASSLLSLTVPSTNIQTTEWQFLIRLDFAPSTTNYVRVYLTSDQQDIENNLNGYFIQFGESGGPDSLDFYRQDGATTTKIFTGTSGCMSSSSSNSVRVKVTRDNSGTWEVYTDCAGGTNFTPEGSFTDNTHTTTAHFGVYCRYSTGSRRDKYFFDDFYVGPIIGDTIPPTVTNVSVISNNVLDLQFSEFLDPATAQNTGNYPTNNGLGTPNTAVLDPADSSLVHLTYSGTFVNGQQNTVTVSGVEDKNGNSIVSVNLPFIFVTPVTTDFKDVVLNELFPDPSPPVSLPEEEFVEIYNASNKTFNLQGWTITDGSSTGTFGTQVFAPGEYLILCHEDDTALFSSFGQVLGLSTFPTLNNSGDSITLLDSSGVLVDVVNYSDSWFTSDKDDGGWTLELVNPNTACSGPANWLPSEDVSGGTPGQINSVFDTLADTVEPLIQGVSVISSTEVQVNFNEAMDESSLQSATYSLDQGISVTQITPVAPEFLAVRLQLNPALDSATAYTLTITGATDCPGNSLTANTVLIGSGVAPQAFEILINEVYPNPDPEITVLPGVEFVELYNPTTKVLRLNGLEISDNSTSSSLSFDVIFPGEYLILTDDGNENALSTYGRVVTVSSLPTQNNSGDLVRLSDANNQTIDAINYDESWYIDEGKENGGWTLERINPADVCGGGSNWRASDYFAGGTPGMENSVFDPNAGLDPANVTGITVAASNQITLSFSKNMDSTSLATATYAVSGFGVDSVRVSGPVFDQVNVFFAQSFTPGTVLNFTWTDLNDCQGNLLSSGNLDFALAQANDLVINEILFDPRGSGTDFVELYNRAEYPINLQGWAMAFFDSDDSLNLREITSQPFVLEPGAYALLSEDNANVLLEYPLAREETFIETDLPTYSNASGSAILVNNLTTQIDRFDYDEDYHFGLVRDPEGFSLERIDFDRTTNDPTNWHTASEDVGGATPGYENSQFQPTDITEGEISIEPEVFSPDGDGFEDVVNINYRFDQPGFVANVTIYDARGREIRKLIRNELLGPEGTFSWDGLNDNGEKARIGIHIVFVEIFNLDGDTELYKETCVVAGARR